MSLCVYIDVLMHFIHKTNSKSGQGISTKSPTPCISKSVYNSKMTKDTSNSLFYGNVKTNNHNKSYM
jgi:hypothetical protein